MRRYTLLIIWILLMLFPVTMLRRVPQMRSVMDALVGSEVMHWIAHSFLFAGLVVLLAYSFKLRLTAKNAALLLIVVLLVGAAQEGFQLIASKHRPPGWPELFDLGVDMVGGLIGMGIWRMSKRGKNSGEPKEAQEPEEPGWS